MFKGTLKVTRILVMNFETNSQKLFFEKVLKCTIFALLALSGTSVPGWARGRG
jgi:hypothetical protein